MKKSELLVPAGGKEQFVAAVENGADAIYIGGKNYSARNNAENFSDEEAEEAVDYGHLKNVKTYVAMNTLLFDDELKGAFDQACRYYEMGVDALIIQDLGLGRVLKNYLPDMPLHLSTQAGVRDVAGVYAAAKLGYERVVLARETGFEEIKKAAATGTEIEVFVHGAMCICYSGQCQLSRYIGGRSGNRGTCAQPCRLPYSCESGQNYPLSPKDMCLIEEAGRLCEAGVSSLKIEGRMKSPEYVAVVTSIYRKYIDLWSSGHKPEVTEEDIYLLRQIYNRGGFTKGYFYGDPGNNLMAADFSKNSGVYMGKAAFASKGPLVEIEYDGKGNVPDIEKGDYVEIRGEKLTSNMVTYKQIQNGKTVIGDLKGDIRKGDPIYRLASADQLAKARRTFENADPSKRGKSSRRVPVNMNLVIEAEKQMRLTASYNGINVTLNSDIIPQKAVSGIPISQKAKSQLAKTGDTAFLPGDICVYEPTPAFIPVSAINRLRRQVLDKLESEIICSFKRKGIRYGFTAAARKPEENIVEVYFIRGKADKNIIDKALSLRETIRCAVPAEEYAGFKKQLKAFYGNSKEAQISVRPYIIPMTSVSKEKAFEMCRWLQEENCGLYVSTLGQLYTFADNGIRLYGDYGLNVTNGEAELACRQLGAASCADSLEKAEKWQGAYPLMITEHEMDEKILVDRKKSCYDVMFFDRSHKTFITGKDCPIDWEKAGKKGSVRLFVR